MRFTATALDKTPEISAITWESLIVDGAVIISRVLNAIDDAAMCIFDITVPNPNVLFEVGYAIGRGKRLWLTLDSK
jgi:hypothetical protein